MAGRIAAEAEQQTDDGRAEGAAVQKTDGQAEIQRFRRFQEVHYQRGYRLEQIKAFLSQAGLEFLEALDADTYGEVTEKSERIYVAARKGAETMANQTAASDKEI